MKKRFLLSWRPGIVLILLINFSVQVCGQGPGIGNADRDGDGIPDLVEQAACILYYESFENRPLRPYQSHPYYALGANLTYLTNNEFGMRDATGVGGRYWLAYWTANRGAVAGMEFFGTVNPIQVKPNTKYVFTFSLMNYFTKNAAVARVFINGIQVGLPNYSNGDALVWHTYFITWNSGAATSADISLRNHAPNNGSDGNDFCIDELFFMSLCDLDMDGTPNFLDPDSDADGMPDTQEKGPDGNNPKDADGNGFPDYLDPMWILPVRFNNFIATGHGDGNQLNWTVSPGNYHTQFVIQYSTNGRDFNNLGTVAFEDGKLMYSYLHRTQARGRHFYRIAGEGSNGKRMYTAIVQVKNLVEGLHIAVHPNPVRDKLRLEIFQDCTSMVDISIIDMAGRRLWQGKEQVRSSETKLIPVNLGAFSAGSYCVQANNGKQCNTIKFQKAE